MVRRIKAKLVLRLRAEGLTGRQIAAQGMSRHSVSAVLDAADREGVGWDDVAELDEANVYARLFPGRGEHESVHAQPDWDKVHRELARVGVTLKLLHGEYVDACRAKGETAMGYDRFCKTYQRHVLVIGAASRVGHKAGQTVEVDWSGKTMQLSDPVEPEPEPSYEAEPVSEVTQEELPPVLEAVMEPALVQVARPEPEPPSAPAAEKEKPRERPLHILLVESDLHFAQSLLEQLHNHEVVHIMDAAEALKAYYERHFDAILCCEHPQGFQGIDLCKKLRQDTRGGYPYFILMTPPAARQNAKAALEAGVDAFLNKPLEPVELQVRLKVARGVQSRLNRVYSSLIPAPPDKGT